MRPWESVPAIGRAQVRGDAAGRAPGQADLVRATTARTHRPSRRTEPTSAGAPRPHRDEGPRARLRRHRLAPSVEVTQCVRGPSRAPAASLASVGRCPWRQSVAVRRAAGVFVGPGQGAPTGRFPNGYVPRREKRPVTGVRTGPACTVCSERSGQACEPAPGAPFGPWACVGRRVRPKLRLARRSTHLRPAHAWRGAASARAGAQICRGAPWAASAASLIASSSVGWA
jgi:hypothetical protein